MVLFIACYIRRLVRIERIQDDNMDAHQAEHVMVKGQWKVTDGHLASGDLESLLENIVRLQPTSPRIRDYLADQNRS